MTRPSPLEEGEAITVSMPASHVSSLAPPRYELGVPLESTRTLSVHAGVRLGTRGFHRAVSFLSVPSGEGAGSIAAAFTEMAIRFAELGHPALVPVEDIWDARGRVFAVTPPLVGGSLARLLEVPVSRACRVAPELACRHVLGLAEGVHALAEADGGRPLGGVSADAVWIAPGGVPLLLPSLNLGVAGDTASGTAEDSLSRYVAPEALRGEPLTPSADVYALGLLLWDLLALGRGSAPDLATSLSPPSIDLALVELVMRSLSLSPADRPRSAAEFKGLLERVVSGWREPALGPARSSAVPALVVLPPPIRLAGEPARVVAVETADSEPVVAIAPSVAVDRKAPCLRVLQGDGVATRLSLGGTALRWVVGRARSADLVVSDPDMSREHFEIVKTCEGDYRVYDLGSKNGLFVNGAPVDQHALRPGDEVRAGATLLGFEP